MEPVPSCRTCGQGKYAQKGGKCLICACEKEPSYPPSYHMGISDFDGIK